MTAAPTAASLGLCPPPGEPAFSDSEPTSAAGEFASLIDQAAETGGTKACPSQQNGVQGGGPGALPQQQTRQPRLNGAADQAEGEVAAGEAKGAELNAAAVEASEEDDNATDAELAPAPQTADCGTVAGAPMLELQAPLISAAPESSRANPGVVAAAQTGTGGGIGNRVADVKGPSNPDGSPLAEAEKSSNRVLNLRLQPEPGAGAKPGSSAEQTGASFPVQTGSTGLEWVLNATPESVNSQRGAPRREALASAAEAQSNAPSEGAPGGVADGPNHARVREDFFVGGTGLAPGRNATAGTFQSPATGGLLPGGTVGSLQAGPTFVQSTLVDAGTGTVLQPDLTGVSSALSVKLMEAAPASDPTKAPDLPAVLTGSASLNPPVEPATPLAQATLLGAQVTEKQELAPAQPAPSQGPSEDGMSPALQADGMQAKHNTEEKSYPGGQNVLAEVSTAEPPRVQEAGRKRLPALDRPAGLGEGPGAANAPVANHPASRELGAPAEASTGVNRATEVVRHAIENATATFRRMEANSVSMVLKPDANTQLALHLKWQHGRFEALAVLERGDLSTLGAQWNHLQSRLAEQGVRLAPLVSNGGQASTFSGSQFSSPRHQHPSTPAGEPVAPAAPAGPSRKSAAPALSGPNRREWWA